MNSNLEAAAVKIGIVAQSQKFELDTTKFSCGLIRILSNGRRREKSEDRPDTIKMSHPHKRNRDELFLSIRKIDID